ncbi:hypothetical protein EFL24_10370 [Lactococcus cremoris]|uniref:hypothetical protein n=1 Tax=Lactococcus lactis subsp. cremoris TaxID=1359 RepID=UPI00223B269C|nr:hypothetical protein [Lactococcus cremoris]MCT0509187.1 hypothetical protein [Lactococcus cremoris]
MSELEKTAPNEIYLIVGDTDKDCNFNELAEVTWADKPIYEETAIKYVKSSQLTIPKSIADELEKYDFELTSKGLMYRNMGGTLLEFSRVTYDEIPQLIVQTIAGNYRIVFAYLAGKALGVDLVKVVEGIDDNY